VGVFSEHSVCDLEEDVAYVKAMIWRATTVSGVGRDELIQMDRLSAWLWTTGVYTRFAATRRINTAIL